MTCMVSIMTATIIAESLIPGPSGVESKWLLIRMLKYSDMWNTVTYRCVTFHINYCHAQLEPVLFSITIAAMVLPTSRRNPDSHVGDVIPTFHTISIRITTARMSCGCPLETDCVIFRDWLQTFESAFQQTDCTVFIGKAACWVRAWT